MKTSPAHSVRRLPAGDRRQQIIAAAIEVFAKHGFRGATTKQLAESAGVSEAIIFRHFATKLDLYAAILDYNAQESGQDQWLEELQKLADRNDDEGLFRAIAERILEGHRRDPQFHRLMLYAALEGQEFSRMLHSRRFPVHLLLHDYVVRRQKAGALRNMDPELVVLALIAMPAQFGLISGVFGFNWLEASGAAAAETFSQILLDGVREPAKGAPGLSLKSTRSSKADVDHANR